MSGSAIPQFGSSNGSAGDPNISKTLATIATPVAIMYNFYDPTLISDNTTSLVTNSINRLILNPYIDASNSIITDASGNQVYSDASGNSYFSMSSFLNLFYATNAGYFNVNPANANNPAIILSSQTYVSTNSLANPFSLVQSLLKAYCDNNGVTVNDLDPRIVLLVQKETFSYQSLATVKGTTISLSWDEVIAALLRSGLIDASGSSVSPKYAAVPLQVLLNYHSFVLNLDLTIVFTYYVDIQGYIVPKVPAAQQTYN